MDRDKIISGTPTVIGINEGAEVLKEIYDQYDQIRLGDNTYEVVERGVTLRKEEFGISDKILSYRFTLDGEGAGLCCGFADTA
jgi:hypothetical protein